jgi:hypothetical protein
MTASTLVIDVDSWDNLVAFAAQIPRIHYIVVLIAPAVSVPLKEDWKILELSHSKNMGPIWRRNTSDTAQPYL